MTKRRSIIALLVIFWGLLPLGLMRIYLPKVWEKKKKDRSERASFWTMPDEFVGYWGDGRAEVARFRVNGTFDDPIVTVTTKVVDFSNSRRVPLGDEKRTIADTIPTLRSIVAFAEPRLAQGKKETTVYIALSPFNGFFGGSVTTSETVFFDGRKRFIHFEKDGLRWSETGKAANEGKLASGPTPMTIGALYLWARGFSGPELSPGESRRMPILIEDDGEGAPKFESFTFERGVEGTPDALTPSKNIGHLMTVRDDRGVVMGFVVEDAWPRRLISWSLSGILLAADN